MKPITVTGALFLVFLSSSNALTQLLGLPILPSLPLPSTCPVLQNSNGCDVSGTSISLPPCSSTVENIATGRPVQGSATQPNGELPGWVNVTLARQGQQFFANNKLNLLLGMANGLLGVLAVADIRQVLLFTHNSDTPDKVLKRYISTGTQTLVWLEDLFKTDENDNAFLTSIKNVRNVHRTAARNVSAKVSNVNALDLSQYDNYTTDDVFWNAFHADLVASNIPQQYRNLSTTYYNFDGNPQPVSQFAQSLTMFGFMGYPFIAPMGYALEDQCLEDWRAWLHLWAIIGHGIGITDPYNIALQPNYAAAKSYLKEVNNQYYVPSFFNLDHGSKVLIEALLQAFSTELQIPGIELRSFMTRFLQDNLQIPTPNLNAILTPAQTGANAGWYSTVIPGLHIPATKAAAGVALDTFVQSGVLAFFGPYVTNMQKAEHVYYTGY